MFLDKYLQYIDYTGGAPTIEQFDEDWEPIGKMVREDLFNRRLIIYEHIDATNKTVIRRVLK